MEEKRKYQRFPVELDGRCFGGSNNEYADCKIIDISKEGISIKLYLKERIKIDSSLVLEINFPNIKESNRCISAVIVLMWIEKLSHEKEFNFVAGGEFTMIDPLDKQRLLDYGHEKLLENKKGL